MSTRTYTIAFTGPGDHWLPQGRFFMIKSAAAALNITCERADAQPVVFENVGAGLQYNSLDAGKWLKMRVESQAAQVVEIVISDDSTVSFANTVSVAGAVATQEQPTTTTHDTPAVTVPNGSQALLIAARPTRRKAVIQADSNNAASCYVRAIGGANNVLELQPGMSFVHAGVDGLDVRNDTGAAATFYIMEQE